VTQPVALITGAGRGIGRAIALELGRDHAVAVNYARSADAAQEVVEQIVASGGQAFAIGGDVGQAADRQRLVDETLARYGRLDVLVNNAGITSQGRKPLLEATEESWDIVFNTNLKGPFFLSQYAAKAMFERIGGGSQSKATIVNISSVSAYAVSSNRADYCMTKAALGMMTLLFADALAEHGIQVFEICPGVIASDMTSAVQEKYDTLIAEGLTPIRRWGQGEDVARAVRAVVGDLFPFSTGERINVDGGFHIRRL